MAELKFLPNDADEGEGLSDAGIETYRADPFPAVARETGQNSRDAHDKTQPDRPVILVIDKLSVPTDSLPDLANYRAVVASCLAEAQARKDAKETAFFRQAAKALGAPTLRLLRISDYNTTGLLGPCVEGQPFHSLVKSTGVSQKNDPTSGGSFGIGKSAVYSASDLQTVFYSTSYLDASGNRKFLCQGKTKLRSFKGPGGKSYRSVGYWGDPNRYMPVADETLAPVWLRRDDTGTTVCSIAVRDSDDWKHETIASVLMNFFSAINGKKMEFNIDGVELNDRTILRHFRNPDIEAAAKTKLEDYAFAKDMFTCLTDTHEAQSERLTVSGAGTFRLRLLVRDGLPKRIGILRNGMYICDNLAQFGEKFARFPMYRDFVAIVEPDDDATSTWLRRMESPRHDEFSAERVLDPAERQTARKAGVALAQAIRLAVKRAAGAQSKAETDLDELSEFFAMDNQGTPDILGVRNIETIRVKPVVKRSRPPQSKAPATDEPGNFGGAHIPVGNEGGGEGGGNGGPGQGGSGNEAGKRSVKRALPLMDLRTFLPDRNDLCRRRLSFTPGASGRAVLRFESSGLNHPEDIGTTPPKIEAQCIQGQRQSIEVRFAAPYDGPIEVTSWSEEATAQ